MSTGTTVSQSGSADDASKRSALIAGLGGLAAGALLARHAQAGPLNPPPGPVASTGRTLSEIEPRTPINAANTPGDSNSVFHITQPGSYYLTGNVTGVASRHGIKVSAAEVSIDLNGFALRGVSGSLNGIHGESTAARVRICNGSANGWGSGIFVPIGGASIEGVSVSGNRLHGIRALNGALVRGCRASQNGSTDTGGVGIWVGDGSIVEDCVASGNLSDGIRTALAAIVTRCASWGNRVSGFFLSSGSICTACTSEENQSMGIYLDLGAMAVECTCRNNTGNGFYSNGGGLIRGCTAYGNGGDGVGLNNGCLVLDCTCRANGAGTASRAGIGMSSGDNRVEGNNCISNNIGVYAAASGNFVTRNTATSNGTNWALVSGNRILVINSTAAGAFSGNSGGTSLGSTDPWANFTY